MLLTLKEGGLQSDSNCNVSSSVEFMCRFVVSYVLYFSELNIANIYFYITQIQLVFIMFNPQQSEGKQAWV